jgi:hypothetical protein
VLTVLVLAGILSRRGPLGPPSLWLDDAWPTLPARAEDTWEAIRTAAFSAPGFIALLTGWIRTVGFSEQAAQMPAFVAGVLGAPAVYVVFRRLRLPIAAGAVGAVLMLVGPAHLDFSTRVKPYTTEALAVAALIGVGWALTRRPTDLGAWLRLTGVALVALALSAATVPAIAGAYAAGAVSLLGRGHTPWRHPHRWIGPAMAVALLQALAGIWWVLFLRRAAANDSLVSDWSEGFVDRESLASIVTSGLELCAASLRAVSPFHPALSALLIAGALAAMISRRWWGPVALLTVPGAVALALALVERVPLGGFRTDAWGTSMFAITIGAGVAAAIPRQLPELRDLGPPLVRLALVAVVVLSLPAAGVIANPYPDEDLRDLVTVAEVGRRRGDIIMVNTASVWAYALYSEETLRLEEDDHQPNGFLPAIDDRRTILLRPARDRRLQLEPRLGPILDRVQGDRRLCLLGSHYNRYWGIALNRLIRDGLVVEHEIRRDGATLVCWQRPS